MAPEDRRRRDGKSFVDLQHDVTVADMEVAHREGVVRLVRGMVEAGSARCVLGNHEFNAIAYPDGRSGCPAGAGMSYPA